MLLYTNRVLRSQSSFLASFLLFLCSSCHSLWCCSKVTACICFLTCSPCCETNCRITEFLSLFTSSSAAFQPSISLTRNCLACSSSTSAYLYIQWIFLWRSMCSFWMNYLCWRCSFGGLIGDVLGFCDFWDWSYCCLSYFSFSASFLVYKVLHLVVLLLVLLSLLLSLLGYLALASLDVLTTLIKS